jgi:hypothetical protein
MTEIQFAVISFPHRAKPTPTDERYCHVAGQVASIFVLMVNLLPVSHIGGAVPPSDTMR